MLLVKEKERQGKKQKQKTAGALELLVPAQMFGKRMKVMPRKEERIWTKRKLDPNPGSAISPYSPGIITCVLINLPSHPGGEKLFPLKKKKVL